MTGRGRILAGALAALCGLLGPSQLPAQIIQLDPPPGQDLSAPAEAAEADPLAPPDPAARGRHAEAAAAAAATPPESEARRVPLRRAAVRLDDGPAARLAGEVAVERFVMFLPADPGAAELRLFHRSSIDVLPEESALRVRVNGTDVGTLAPDNFSGFAEDAMPVPAGTFRPGRNLVEVTARHTHRIACGPDASFAVWTEIETGLSGISMPRAAFRPDPQGFLSALAAEIAQGGSIPVRRADPGAPLVDAAPFIAEVSAMLGGMPPEVESGPYWTVAGGPAPMARITVFPAGEGPPAPRFARGGDGALVLLLDEGVDWAEVSRLFRAAADMPQAEGLAVLRPGRPAPLAAFAPDGLTAEGRYARVSAAFGLPSDWLVLTSQKARLDLDYRFAAGLPEGALMLVKVNGTTVRMLPLDAGDGAALPTLPVTFPARLMRPGANLLDFEVLVPGNPVDRACPALGTPVVEVSTASVLHVPPTPRMSLPSIDRALAGVTPDHLAPTDRAAAQVAPGFVPQLAAALMPTEVAAPDAGEVRLTVATLADLEVMDHGVLGRDLSALAETLNRPRFPEAGPLAAAATAWDVLDGEDAAGPAGGIRGLADRGLAVLRRMAFGASQPLDVWLAERTAQAALVQPDPARPGEIWLVLGPQAEPAEIARAVAVGRGRFDGPTGQLAVYDSATGWQSWVSPERQLRLHETITARNLREIMGTYATLVPLHFIAATLLLTALSVVVAVGFLITSRGRGA
ncbi:cellulose biosynthesis cyclic di-GMP-binding regulatory protein BcsB [Roseibacterium sp. SDUM158017]|uniref:cellulose biosynthesis cyclic di-GMP-binding regulatory protein BcsB n=1 Tax=Roseicyclus salinarum TaxID=3036773 RepID=UPI002415248F|nr:cellulose biosynthesis cyclic di-GMP-binding regulatory protein BcsB [Roseibacterium sp. SDUM158017]MDG4649220.1 cellulose biosynthesis cyclic di-GMP-binding regulatory protein BcsB [Roseibacterium sp. SDUM158017]